jgi:hypothetical protein
LSALWNLLDYCSRHKNKIYFFLTDGKEREGKITRVESDYFTYYDETNDKEYIVPIAAIIQIYPHMAAYHQMGKEE